MSLSQTQKAIIAIIMFGLSGFIVYNSFFKSALIISDNSFSEEDSDSQDIIDLAEEFQDITINASVFSSPLFRSLKNADSSVSQEIQGRDNPFASIGKGN
ncbi:MAG: hypothetical protein WC095_00305 [Candidatus Paceibacterota bacterium]